MRLLIVSALTLISSTFALGENVEDQLPEKLIPGMVAVIDAAMERSSTMDERELIEAELKGRRISSSSAVLPSLSASSSYRQEDNLAKVSEIGFEERFVYSVYMQQPLYHWGALSAGKKIGKLQYGAELLNTTIAGDNLLSNVRRLYMDLMLANLDLIIKTEDVSMKRRQYDTQEERRKLGLVSDGSMHTVQVSLEKSEISQLQSAMNRDDKLLELVNYSGVDENEIIANLVDEIPVFEPLLPEDIKALESQLEVGVERSEYVVRQSQVIEISRKQLNIARVAMRPKFDIRIGMSQNARDSEGVRRESEYLYAGLRASWSIFDGFRTRGRKMEALARLKKNEELKGRLETQLKRNGKKTLFALEMASRRLIMQEQEYRIRTNSLNAATDNFEAGRISNLDLVNARQRYRQVTLSTQRSRVGYLNALGAVSILLEK